MKIKKRKIQKSSLLVLLLKVFLCGLLLSQATSSVVYAYTFVGPSTLSIDGTFTDWGTPSSPTSGIYLFHDTNVSPPDGNGFAGKEADINYFWSAVSTENGGDTPPSPSNKIKDFYYRWDTNYDKAITGQSYHMQLNLGTANPGYADHLLEFWVDDGDTPKVTLILWEYNTPYPAIGALTSGSVTARVSNISGYGVQDTNATGAMGKYDGTNYGVEVNIPADWFSPTYGGSIEADGSGACAVIGTAFFTDTGTLGSVGSVKDTLNEADGDSIQSVTDVVDDGETDFVTDDISKIVFTTDAQTLYTGQVSSVMTIQTQDATCTPQNVSADTTIDLTSTSVTGLFSLNDSPWSDITSVTIYSGNNSASFYYKDTTAGTPTITAAENPPNVPDWTDATQQETIVSAITNTPDSYPFGILGEGETANTVINHFTVTNNSGFAVDITIQGTDLTGGVATWTLADTADTDTYALKAGLDDADDNFDITVKKTAPNYLVEDLAGEGTTQGWGLKIYMPTPITNKEHGMSGTVTLIASPS